MRKKLFTIFVSALCVLAGVLVVNTTAQAQAKTVFTLAVAYEDQGYNSFQPYPWIHKADYPLQWTTNSCYTGQRYNWYAGEPGLVGLGNSSMWMSSIKNTSVGCNTIWLNARAPYSQYWTRYCVNPGNGVNWFPWPYNDNIRQVTLARESVCS